MKLSNKKNSGLLFFFFLLCRKKNIIMNETQITILLILAILTSVLRKRVLAILEINCGRYILFAGSNFSFRSYLSIILCFKK